MLKEEHCVVEQESRARKPLGTLAMEKDRRQKMENEILKVNFTETSGVKDLGGHDHLKASGGKQIKT